MSSNDSAGAPEMIRGSVVVHRRRCGKPNCRCAGGDLHEATVLSYSERGPDPVRDAAARRGGRGGGGGGRATGRPRRNWPRPARPAARRSSGGWPPGGARR